ncbi:hypothetical protein Tsubulata_003435 [Turnera subulata]|uniref:Uncharacterized protein n=1 Tax=Turnera subulata TaxID=218843 RepID=A0A9Q0JCZ5_9ROSI|nr:hypothetical protein Tsubulata_003435 [Turnera subulata]
MYEQQHFVDSHDNNSNFGDSKSWLSGPADHRVSAASSHHARSQLAAHSSAGGGPPANLDPELLSELADLFPLIQTYMDQKPSSSFTRRGSMAYTKTPSRQSKKGGDAKGRNAGQSMHVKKKGEKDQGKVEFDNMSVLSSRASATEKELEELATLREQVEDLQKKLLEKDELLKSAEVSKNQMNDVHVKFNELKKQAAEKESLLKSTQLKLSDAKIKLADKQAALEKTQWEVMQSNRKVEKLQEELDSVQGDISSFTHVFESLTKNDCTKFAEDYDIKPCFLDHLLDNDNLDDMEMQRMEEAREAYLAAVAALKDKPDEESITAASSARLHLQSFVLRSNSMNGDKYFPNGMVS